MKRYKALHTIVDEILPKIAIVNKIQPATQDLSI